MYERSAIISKCRKYRYELRRTWQIKTGLVCWVMLNPSTADANFDDPTIRRCMGYTARWGYGGIIVVNLFAFRATNPSELKKIMDPIGPKNNTYLEQASSRADITIAAWGDKGTYLQRDTVVMPMLKTPHYLHLTKKGNPHHPLYLLNGLEPIAFVSNNLLIPNPERGKIGEMRGKMRGENVDGGVLRR